MIELLPFKTDDFQRLIKWIDSPIMLEQWGRWRFEFPLTVSQLHDYVHSVGGIHNFYIFKAVNKVTEHVIGHIELNYINHPHKTASICRVFVDPKQRGRGYGKQTVFEALKIGFNTLNLHRIDLQVYHKNLGAIKCYTKIGFVTEGKLRHYRQMENGYWDLIMMSMLKDEWDKLYPEKKRTRS